MAVVAQGGGQGQRRARRPGGLREGPADPVVGPGARGLEGGAVAGIVGAELQAELGREVERAEIVERRPLALAAEVERAGGGVVLAVGLEPRAGDGMREPARGQLRPGPGAEALQLESVAGVGQLEGGWRDPS
jgi:hypothetical protein